MGERIYCGHSVTKKGCKSCEIGRESRKLKTSVDAKLAILDK